MSDENGSAPHESSTGSPKLEDFRETVPDLRVDSATSDIAPSALENTDDHQASYENCHKDARISEHGLQRGMTAEGNNLANAGQALKTPRENQTLQDSLENGLERLVTLRELVPATEWDSVSPWSSIPNLDVVVVHGFFGARQSPWENPGTGSSEWLRSMDHDPDCRVMSFDYDASGLLSGIHTRKFIRGLATKLLEELKIARRESSQKRSIMFVAHDLGGTIVKDALAISGLQPALYGEIFDYTRLLFFHGCFHRALTDGEMENKLNWFLYRPFPSEQSNYPLPMQSTRALARAVVEINQLYLDSKHMYRSYVFSTFSKTDTSTVDKAFNRFTSTLGIPFERPITAGLEDSSSNIEKSISQLSSLIFTDDDSIGNERTLLSASSPLSMLRSHPGPDHPFSWISDNSQYRSWYKQRKAQLLYLLCDSGAQSASEYIFYNLNEVHRKDNGQVVIYFNFDRYDIRRDNIQDMLTTIQAQMLGHFPTLRETFKLQLEQHRRDRSLHYKDLLYWFEYYRNLGEVGGTSFVLNNFDECEPISRKAFLDQLAYISQVNERPLRFLVTSRQPRTLLEELSDWPTLDLDQSAPEPDQKLSAMSYESLSRLYSNVRGFKIHVDEDIRSITNLALDTQNLILQYVVQDEGWPSDRSITDIFGPLEAITLESAVAKIMDNIPDKSFALHVLAWILYAVRPPTVWELAAVTYSMAGDNLLGLTSSETLADGVRDKLQIWLAGIVTISQTEASISNHRIREALYAELGNTTGLSHMAGILTPKAAHEKITKSCLDYLSFPTVQVELEKLYDVTRYADTHLPMLCDRTSLVDYATQFWVHHLALSSDSLVLGEGPTTELAPFHDSSVVKSWCKAHWVLSNPFTRSEKPSESLYPILAGAGLADQAEGWCRGDSDLSAGLVEACFSGSLKTVGSLLPRLRYTVPYLEEALVGAGAYGDEAAWLELISHIHKKYADFPWTTQTPLVCRASWSGQQKVLKKLLEVGSPPDEEISEGKKGRTALRQAVYMNNLAAAKILLSHGADAKQLMPYGRTLIHSASALGHAEMVRILAEHGADPNARTTESFTAIYDACLWGNHKVVEALVSLGADPNIKATEDQDEPAWSPLTCAISEGHIECALAILSSADVKLDILGVRGVPLLYAVNQGHLSVCQGLLDRGVDPNNHPLSDPILVEAAALLESDSHLDIIELLIKNGARVNDADGFKQTALHWVCWSERPQMLAAAKLLLEHGADVNCQSHYGSAPLHIAVGRNNVKLLELLAKSTGVNLDVSNKGNQTPLLMACNSEELARVLLKEGANPNARPVLVEAVRAGNEEVVTLLLQHNALVEPPEELRNLTQWEPMELAALIGRSNILRILADAGGNVNRRFRRGRPLISGTIRSNSLRALLEFRPELDAQDDFGYGALHCIHASTSLENVKLLVRAGANINLVTNYNTTPLVKALIEGQEEAANYLLSKDAGINIISSTYGGPLHAACRSGLVGMVKRLIGLRADVNLVVPGMGGSPLSSLFYGYGVTPKIQTEILDILLEAGLDVTIPSGLIFGTAGVSAAWSGVEEHIRKLVAEGASFVAKDYMGRQPLHLAAVRGNMDVFTAILRVSDKLDRTDNCGRNLVSWAAQGGNIEILEKVLQLVGNEAINEPDMTGWTPLCWAAREVGTGPRAASHGSQEVMIAELLRRGADKSAKSGIKGKEYTPQGIAMLNNCDEDVVEILAPGNTSLEAQNRTDKTLGSRQMDGIPPKGRRLRIDKGDSYCDFCMGSCPGTRYTCQKCEIVCFCYKCYELKHKIHPSDHEFEARGEEFQPYSESPLPHSPTPAHSSSDASSSVSDDISEDET